MKKYIKNIIKLSVIAVICGFGFASCNKDLLSPIPLLYPKNGDTTMFGILNRDTSLSFYKAAVVKAGLTNLFNDNTTIFTAFIPNNAAFIASGIPSIAGVNSLPTQSVAAIVSYSIIPGEQFIDTLTSTTTAFPNVQLPSYFTISTIPGTAIPLNMPIFPAKRPTGFWVNNIPVVSSNKRVQNGIIHIVAAIVNPPSTYLSNLISSDPTLTIFNAAIARGDSGQLVGSLNQIGYVLGYAPANLTVFAPTNTALKAFISALTGGAIPVGAPDATFIGFLNTSVPVLTVRGLVTYHIMPYRAFSVNFPTTAAFFPTLLNQGIPTHPGVMVKSTIVGGFGAALAVTGVANGGIAANATAPSNLDKNAINGVEHVIDRVLLPQ